MKKLVFLAVCSAFLISACGDDDNGGSGAEFDASLYYTKADVDQAITDIETSITALQNALPVYDSLLATPSTAAAVNNSTGSGYGNAVPAAGWTNPAQGNLVAFQIVSQGVGGGYATTTETIELNIGIASDNAGTIIIPIEADRQIDHTYILAVADGAIKIWPSTDISAGNEIAVQPMIWFGSNL